MLPHSSAGLAPCSAPWTEPVSYSPRYQGEAVVGRSRHLAAFSSGLQHFGPQRGTVDGDLTDGDDQLTVQSHKCVELLDDLKLQ